MLSLSLSAPPARLLVPRAAGIGAAPSLGWWPSASPPARPADSQPRAAARAREGCGTALMFAGRFHLSGVSPQRDLGLRGVFFADAFLRHRCQASARRRAQCSVCWQADVLPAEENQLGYLMSRTHLRAIADANTDCAVEPALTSAV